MKQMICILTIIAVGFFQFMPILHAGLGVMGHANCTEHETETHTHNVSTDEEHDMSICLDVMRAIGIVSSYPKNTTIASIITSSYQLKESYWDFRHGHKPIMIESPPYFQGHTLVGIVKLTI